MKHIILYCLILLGYTGCSTSEQPIPTGAKIIWKTNFFNNTKSSGSFQPVIYKDLVIYSTTPDNGSPNTIVSFNKNDGIKAWEWKDAIINSLDISDAATYTKDNILIVCAKRNVYAIDMNNGKTLWKNSVPEGAYSIMNGFGDYIFHHRSALDKTRASIVMANIHDGNWRTIYTNMPNDGKTVFFSSFYILKNSESDTIITFCRNVSTFNYSKTVSFITKYNLTKDSIIFDTQISDDQIGSSRFYKNNITIFTNQELVCYDLGTMLKKWTESNFVIRAMTDDGIMIGNTLSNNITAMEFDGRRQLFVSKIKSNPESNALIHNNFLYYSNGYINAFDMKTGNQVWNLGNNNRPTLYDRILTIDKEKGRIYTASYGEAICFETIK